jgi:hypothetical protein
MGGTIFIDSAHESTSFLFNLWFRRPATFGSRQRGAKLSAIRLAKSLDRVVSHPFPTLRMMQLGHTNNTHSRDATSRHWIRWSLLTVGTVIVIANWRVVAAVIAIVTVLSLVIGVLVVIGLLRRLARPIGKLSLIDAAIITWVCRRWDERRATYRTKESSNVTNVTPR